MSQTASWHVHVCAKSLRDAMVGGFSKGIEVAKIVLENALEEDCPS
jgi:hypothetical protein